jgi:hypothetical protein
LHDRSGRGRSGGGRALAGNWAAAGDATRFVVIVSSGLGGRCADFGWRRSGLCCSNGFGLRRCNRLGGNGRRSGFRCTHRLGRGGGRLRLRLDLDGSRRGFLGDSFGRRWGICGRLGRFCRRGGFGRGSLLRGRLLHRLDFFRLLIPGQSITNCATFEPIGLCLDEGARVGLHTHTHCIAQRHHFGVGHSELLGELVHAHVFRQNQFSLSLASACRTLFRQPLILSCW